MTRIMIVLSVISLGGCAATQDQVTSALRDQYTGQKADQLVMRFRTAKYHV
jgi:hypothetical protein